MEAGVDGHRLIPNFNVLRRRTLLVLTNQVVILGVDVVQLFQKEQLANLQAHFQFGEEAVFTGVRHDNIPVLEGFGDEPAHLVVGVDENRVVVGVFHDDGAVDRLGIQRQARLLPFLNLEITGQETTLNANTFSAKCERRRGFHTLSVALAISVWLPSEPGHYS